VIMYAILNQDGTLAEIRSGDLDPERMNTDPASGKRYAVPYDTARPAARDGEHLVFDRREITADGVVDHYRAEARPAEPPSLEQRIAEIEGRVATLENASKR